MLPMISHRMKMQCSNPQCHHVYEYYDNEYMVINDPGIVVFKCPECGELTAAEVKNVDVFRWPCYRGDVVYVYEPDYDDVKPEYADVARGEFREYTESEEVSPIEIPKEPVWVVDGRDIEQECREVMVAHAEGLKESFAKLINAYLAGVSGADDISRLEVVVALGDRRCRFVKEVKSERDFNSEELTLVEVDGVDLEQIIDGVYTRNRCLAMLGNMLMRWRLECDELFFVSPFIGFQYSNDKCAKEICEFWSWLGSVLDIDKTRVVTRRSSLTALKKAYKILGKEYEELKKWNDLNRLVETADNYDGRKKDSETSAVKLYHQSHAKFYAGVFADRVEVIVGSYNLHTGEYLENMTFKRYTREKFSRDYIEPFGLTLRESMVVPMTYRAVIEVDKMAGVVAEKLV